MQLEPIADHLRPGMNILFVGFNPSIRSSETGHHYANPNNRFWTILHEAGLTPRKFAPHEYQELLALGFGLTNIVERPTREAAEISKEEYMEGAVLLRKKIDTFRPTAVCFVGKGVYKEFSGKRKIDWGVQEDSVVPGTIEFVAPSSSGLVRIKLIDIIEIYKGLNKFL